MAKVNEKVWEEIRKQYPDAVVTTFWEKEDCAAILLIPDWEGWTKAAIDFALSRLGVSQETLDYLENSTKEERDELKRLAKIHYHTKELERLQNQI